MVVNGRARVHDLETLQSWPRGELRELRGGFWYGAAHHLRVADRGCPRAASVAPDQESLQRRCVAGLLQLDRRLVHRDLVLLDLMLHLCLVQEATEEATSGPRRPGAGQSDPEGGCVGCRLGLRSDDLLAGTGVNATAAFVRRWSASTPIATAFAMICSA